MSNKNGDHGDLMPRRYVHLQLSAGLENPLQSNSKNSFLLDAKPIIIRFVYFLIYSAHPNAGTEDDLRYEGAHVACWIDVENIELARSKAQNMIRNRGWTVENLEEEYSTTREIAETSTGLQYYEQALIDGEVLVFNTSPRGET